MRDYVLTAFMVWAIPYALMHPVYGVYLWTWLSVMNPHRLTWGFAYDIQFAMFTALATLIGLVLTKEPRRWPVAPPTVALALFLVWITLGYPFALFPGRTSYEMWSKVMKIQLMTLVAAALIVEREHVKRLVWVLVLSLGFYGVKGGLFTIRSGGEHKVWGPDGHLHRGKQRDCARDGRRHSVDVVSVRGHCQPLDQIRPDCGDGTQRHRRDRQLFARGVCRDRRDERRDLVVQQAKGLARQWGCLLLVAMILAIMPGYVGRANVDDFQL